MSNVTCLTCGKADTSSLNFLLTCSGTCKRSWHSKCYLPNITREVMTRMLKSEVAGDLDNGVRSWKCTKCYRRSQAAEASKSATRSNHIPAATPTSVQAASRQAPTIIPESRPNRPLNSSNFTPSSPATSTFPSRPTSITTVSASLPASTSRPTSSEPIDLTSLHLSTRLSSSSTLTFTLSPTSIATRSAPTSKLPSSSASEPIDLTSLDLPARPSRSSTSTFTPGPTSITTLSAPISAPSSRPPSSSSSEPIDLTSLDLHERPSSSSAITNATSESTRAEAPSSPLPHPRSYVASFRPYSRPTQLLNNASTPPTIPSAPTTPPVITPPITQLPPVHPIARPPRNPPRHAARKTRATVPPPSTFSSKNLFDGTHPEVDFQEIEPEVSWLSASDGPAQAVTSTSESYERSSSTGGGRTPDRRPYTGSEPRPLSAPHLSHHSPSLPPKAPSPPPPLPPPPPPSHYIINQDQTVDLYALQRHMRAAGKLAPQRYTTFTLRSPSPEVEPPPRIPRQRQDSNGSGDEEEQPDDAANKGYVDSDDDMYASAPPSPVAQENNPDIRGALSDLEDSKEDDDEVDGALDLSDEDSDIIVISHSKPNRDERGPNPRSQGKPKGGECFARMVRLRTGRHLGAYQLASAFYKCAIKSPRDGNADAVLPHADEDTDPAGSLQVMPMDTREGDPPVGAIRRRPRKAQDAMSVMCAHEDTSIFMIHIIRRQPSTGESNSNERSFHAAAPGYHG
ncbi:hypothetical protein OF83DRAFT_115012 [Amylostereum chailletii]|nr:hypothetical protein OF83DRAFT_115012 [Amylostereum chailletii]